MNSSAVIHPGARVRMHYTLSYADGTEIDSTLEGEPVAFVIGDDTLAAGLEQALLGMAPGQRERILLGPGEAFGERDESNVHRMPRADFTDMDLAEGSLVSFELPSGEEIPGVITAMDDDSVEVDFNHPLAGQPLQFYVEILSIADPE